MVMNYGLIDTYLHMSNHYKLINSAKSVVNTSPPKSFILRNKKQSSSSPNTRYSTPTLLSKNDRLPSRTNSHYEFGRKNIKLHNCLQPNDLPVSRSVSAPTQKYSRKLSTTWGSSSFLKNKQQFTTKNDTKSKTTSVATTNDSSSARVSRESSNYSVKPEVKHVSYDQPKTLKTPIPTPRRKLPSNKPMIPNYEYLQFSLRITEDIIRNDLYNPNEMQRVFNSHLEANRGRLDMTKMLQQIDHLCKELSITANVNTDSSTKSGELSLRRNSKMLLDKIANNQYEMSSEEIRNLSGTELQNLITGILDPEKKEVPISIQFQSNDNIYNKKTDIEAELFDLKKKNATTTSDESTKYFDIATIKSDEKECKIDESKNVCTDLVPVSFVSEKDKPETPKHEKQKILITPNEIANSVNISQNIQNKEITIINLESKQLHNDLIEINKNLTEGFHSLKETITNENPVKEVLTPKTPQNRLKTSVEQSEVSIKKNEITQTPFSKEIAHFCDKLPEKTIAEDNKQTKEIVLQNKDVLHFVGITEKVEIENVTKMYQQINVYEPINIIDNTCISEFDNSNYSETTERSSENNIGVGHDIGSNFISTVNNLILDGINDLFEPIEPILPKDIVPHIVTGAGDYYKYENKNNHYQEDKYINDKYKLHQFSNREEHNHLYNKPITPSQKSSDISLSEGEILVTSKLKRREPEIGNPSILEVLQKYEYKSWEHNNINKYKLNKFELNYDPSTRNVHFLHHSSTTTQTPLTSSKNSRVSTVNRQESLLSDGEIKYSSSDSEDCKTDYSNNSSKV